MKKWITFTLVLTILFSVFCVPCSSSAHDQTPDADAYIKIEENKDKLFVYLYVIPHSDMNVKGMSFQIKHFYNYGVEHFPFAYNSDNSDLYLEERFSSTLIANDNFQDGTVNLAWNTESAVFLTADEEVLLAKIPLTATSSANDGEYTFSLTCTSFFCSVMDDMSQNENFVDMQVTTPLEPIIIWHGEHLSSDFSEGHIVVSGQSEFPFVLHLNKNIDMSSCYFRDSSIAKIKKIENASDGSGSDIYVIGKKPGTTELTIYGGYNNYESVVVTINVYDAMPYFLNISQSPTKTVYTIDEQLDLSGMILEIMYDNYDVDYITYTDNNAADFTIEPYDFSTAGNKQIKVSYCGLYAYIDVVVEDATPSLPDVPITPDVLRGDMNSDELVTDADAIYLLYYTFFPNDYPLNQAGDFNGDGIVTDADAIYLLYYTFFPNDYPL